MFKKLSLFLITIFSLIFLSSFDTFAGGGRVEVQINNPYNFTDSEAYVQASIRSQDGTRVNPGEKAEFRIENPRNGDRCETTTSVSNENGWVFGKCFAKEPGNYLIYVHLPDSNYDSSRAIIYFYAKPTPTPRQTPTVTLYYTGMQRDAGGPKRYVSLKWNNIPEAVKYNVYVRTSDDTYSSALLGTSLTYSEVGINKDFDYYAKVEACIEPTNCVSSNEAFIPKMERSISPIPTNTYEETSNAQIEDKNVEDLNKKVETLEKKVNESQKKQNELEKTLNNLIFWIKIHFPFFK